MATRHGSGQVDAPSWNPSKHALWSRRWADPDEAHPTSILLRHPTFPFVRVVGEIDDDTLQEMAFDYLSRANTLETIQPALELPDDWLAALAPNADDSRFGWLPIGWPPKDFGHEASAAPLVSFRAYRKSRLGDDQTVILLASDRIQIPLPKDSGPSGDRLIDFFLGSELGIRVVAHIRPAKNDEHSVAITGMSASLPVGHYVQGVWRNELSVAKAEEVLGTLRAADMKAEIAQALGFVEGSVSFRGIRLSLVHGDWQVERRGTGLAKSLAGGSNVTPYAFICVGTLAELGTLVRKDALVADATDGYARVFPIDPASHPGAKDSRWRRPTRTEEQLDEFRVDEKITDGREDPLVYPLGAVEGADWMRVMVSPDFVREDAKDIAEGKATPGGPTKVELPGGGPAIRSNDFAAVSAYKNVEQFFKRLDAYGIPVEEYFRLCKLPLKVAYRSGIRPGPGKDGQTVNAQVLPEGRLADFFGPVKLEERPAIQMHLALANLSHRARKKWDGEEPSPAEPLGIAADGRWIWHEIGHVLLLASVGELEFRFAHSPGDALAAIIADPRSQLATNARLRGRTFPWVSLTRRHDRCVLHGWSWSGSLHRALSLVPGTAPPRRKGYWSEQILSSSLFRIYRCLGGDTTEVGSADIDEVARELASHYCVYLIFRAI